MTQPAKGQEPSMEEILASIRRIIADDQPANETTASRQEHVATARESAAPAPARPPAAPSQPAPMSPPPRIAPADAAASTPPMTEEEIDSMLAHLRGTPRQPPAGPARTEAAAASEPAPTLDAPRAAVEERGLLSAATTAAVDTAFDALARTAQARNGQRTAAADAQGLARRESAGHGRAPGARRDRARLARTRLTPNGGGGETDYGPPMFAGGWPSAVWRRSFSANHQASAGSATAVAMNSGTAVKRSNTNAPAATPSVWPR